MATTDEKPTQPASTTATTLATDEKATQPASTTATTLAGETTTRYRLRSFVASRGRHALRLPRRRRRAEATPAPPAAPPRLTERLELVGEYQESGFKKAPYIARRADGQMVQLPELLYRLAEEIDGERGYDEIASRLSARVKRGIDAETAAMIVDKKLRPLGVAAAADGSTPELQKVDPLLALKLRAAVVPRSLTRTLTTLFLPFFHPLVIVLLLAAVVAVDVWFFFFHGIAQSLRAIAYNPILFLMVIALVVLATALHEIGHATAARYGGAEPGAMGVGIYIVWPAFYTDVTDAYRLNRRGRLRTDLGGIYFNGLFIVAIAATYAYTGFEPLLVLILVQHMQVLQQFLPFLRLDGYYVLSDLTGVPDMFRRVKPTLKSVLPGNDLEPEVEELKPWVRRVTTAWVLLLIPVLLGIFAMLIVNAPRMIATAYDSLLMQIDMIRAGSAGGIAMGAVQSVVLLLPLAGLTHTLGRIAGRVSSGVWSWSAAAPMRRAVVLPAAIALGVMAGYIMTPNGDYRPIQVTERGTLQGAFGQLRAVHTGRPGLTPRREQELAGAPNARTAGRNPAQGTPTSTQNVDGSSSSSSTSSNARPPGPSTAGADTDSSSGTQSGPGGSTAVGTDGQFPTGSTTGTTTTPWTSPIGTSTAPASTSQPTTTTAPPTTTTQPRASTTEPPPTTTQPPPTTTQPPPTTTQPPPTTTQPPPTTTQPPPTTTQPPPTTTQPPPTTTQPPSTTTQPPPTTTQPPPTTP